MGAEPGEAYVALGVPEGVSDEQLRELADGLAEVAEREGVSVVGGDVTRAPGAVAGGHLRRIRAPGPAAGDPLRREARRRVAVTGELGGAAGGLRLLDAPGSSAAASARRTRGSRT